VVQVSKAHLVYQDFLDQKVTEVNLVLEENLEILDPLVEQEI
jgi:hypothetical protein